MRRTVPVVAAALLLGCVEAASAQTASEIVEKHLAAVGGRETLSKLTSMTVTAMITLTSPVGDLSGTLELNQTSTKQRTRINLDLSAAGAGQMVFEQRFDGKVGYAMDPLQGDREITGDQLESMKNEAFPDPLLDYEKRGVTVTLAGREKVGDRDAHVLLVQPKTGPAVRQFIDAQSFLVVRAVTDVNTPETGPYQQTVDFLDYRDADGTKVPFQIRMTSPIQNLTATVTKVEHNQTFDPSIFSKPAN